MFLNVRLHCFFCSFVLHMHAHPAKPTQDCTASLSNNLKSPNNARNDDDLNNINNKTIGSASSY